MSLCIYELPLFDDKQLVKTHNLLVYETAGLRNKILQVRVHIIC